VSGTVNTAVILAAGMGSRLASEMDDRPKGLMVLGERPIIEESIRKLAATGVERVVLVTGHMREAYEEFAQDFPGLVVTAHNPRYRDSVCWRVTSSSWNRTSSTRNVPSGRR
jgi:2-aminoethylphosphonate-pyruvate transaminase